VWESAQVEKTRIRALDCRQKENLFFQSSFETWTSEIWHSSKKNSIALRDRSHVDSQKTNSLVYSTHDLTEELTVLISSHNMVLQNLKEEMSVSKWEVQKFYTTIYKVVQI